MTGRRVGHFEILEKLGEGGMGVVYKARDVELNRYAAIKVLPASAAADSERRQRFLREAQAASALNHPNIVTVYEIFREEGNEFIAMELVDGNTLDAWLGPKGQRLEETLRVAGQVASALAAAHDAGIVHRDLKPANVMVTRQGHVKVLDFGLAKLTDASAGEQDATLTDAAARTEKGTVMGTVAYMSPEQAEGLKVDWRSDIFSFGSLLYELVAGRRAFQAASRTLTLAAVMEKEPLPLSEVAPGVPRELQRLIARCLRKKIGERAQSLLDVQHALEELRAELEAGQLSGPVRAASSRTRPWWPVAAGAVLVLAAAGVFLAGRSQRRAQVDYKAAPLTSYPGREMDPALSPDGKLVAFAWDGPARDNLDIYVRRIGAGEPLRLTSSDEADRSPAWSRDGDFLAFTRGGAVYVIPALGGTERKLCDLRGTMSSPQPLSWAADGRVLIVSESHQLVSVQVETGEKREIDLHLNRQSHYHVTAPVVSPDGKQLAFILADSEGGDSIRVARLTAAYQFDGAGRDMLPSRQNSFTSLAWAPDGKSLYFTDGKGGAPKLFQVSMEEGAAPDLVPGLGEHIAGISVSGARLVYSYAFHDVNLWRSQILPAGKLSAPAPFQQSTRIEWEPAYSPDGGQIAFVSDRSGENEVWVAAADGTQPRQITRGGSASHLGWSPDGAEILFSGAPAKGRALFRVRVQGGAATAIGPSAPYTAQWTNDGKGFYFGWAPSGEQYTLHRASLTGGEKPVAIVDLNGDPSDFLESPDGRFVWLLDGTNTSGRGLFKVPAAGGEPTLVLPLKGVRNYAPHREGIYFIEAGTAALTLYRYAGGKAVTLARFDGPAPMLTGTGRRRFTVSPDGRTIVYAREDQRVDDLMIVENFR